MENNIIATVQEDPLKAEVPKEVEPPTVAPTQGNVTPKAEVVQNPIVREKPAANPQENAMQTRARKKNEKEKPSMRTRSNPKDAMASSTMQQDVESEPNRVFRLKYAFQQSLVKLSSSETRERVQNLHLLVD